ncbi:hypothetical protein [Shinella sp.]|uniref:hypothetical protein n=1 Tax=Shinella sp. TaxID=1870904 RepID=UPI0028A1F2F3|nr:hypothetical protein [Shinella sp.]
MTDGVTVRIFRLIETAGVEAIRSGSERIAIESFTDGELVLPLISMTQYSERQLQRRITR